MASPSGGEAPNSPQTPPVIKRSRRLWPFLLLVGAGAGAGGYALWTTTLKDESSTETEKVKDDTESAASTSTSTSTSTAAATIKATETPVVSTAVVIPRVRDPIPEDHQRELFRWILEEKRKVKPKGRDEKRQIDDDKAVLKKFILAKSIPNL